jgi:hypothetical protein
VSQTAGAIKPQTGKNPDYSRRGAGDVAVTAGRDTVAHFSGTCARGQVAAKRWQIGTLT